MPRPEHDPAIEFERQRKRKVMLVGILLGVLCALFIWQLFSPGAQTQVEGFAGINATVPDGRAQRTEGDKRKAAEQVRTEEQQNRRMQTLGDNTFSLMDDGLKPAQQSAPADDPVRRAAEANRVLHTQVQGFYAQPSRNAEVEALREQVEALSEQLEAARQQPDPLKLAEEQYKLAQKYLGGGQQPQAGEGSEKARLRGRVSVMCPVREGDIEATTLNPAADFSVQRNMGFLTAAGRKTERDAQSIRACVDRTQVIRAGSTVRLRLLDAVRIDDAVIPRNTPVYGAAAISGMRLQLVVSSIEYEGRIFPVEAAVYDLDGQPGLNVPDSKERTALKDALASVGQTAGMSVNVSHGAGQQVVGELARGGLQASTRYISEKLREVKITLKANHRVLLISKEQ